MYNHDPVERQSVCSLRNTRFSGDGYIRLLIYSRLLRDSDSAWQIQKWMLTVIHWTEHWLPNEGARESTQGAEGVCGSIVGTTIWTKQYPQISLGLNHQSKKMHGGTHVSSCICSRGWPSQSSFGGEAFGPMRVQCTSIGEWQGQEAGVGGLVSKERREKHRVLLEGKPGKGITFEM